MARASICGIQATRPQKWFGKSRYPPLVRVGQGQALKKPIGRITSCSSPPLILPKLSRTYLPDWGFGGDGIGEVLLLINVKENRAEQVRPRRARSPARRISGGAQTRLRNRVSLYLGIFWSRGGS